MNPTISADALVTAALWLLALGLPLAMLLWMAAQYVALRALGRRIAALEARADAEGAAATAATHVAAEADGAAERDTESVTESAAASAADDAVAS